VLCIHNISIADDVVSAESEWADRLRVATSSVGPGDPRWTPQEVLLPPQSWDEAQRNSHATETMGDTSGSATLGRHPCTRLIKRRWRGRCHDREA